MPLSVPANQISVVADLMSGAGVCANGLPMGVALYQFGMTRAFHLGWLQRMTEESPMTKIQARRDATGHMNPEYERDLLEESQENRSSNMTDSAFIYRPRAGDELGEELGEAFVESATSGEEAGPERLDRPVPEEQGGPFVRSNAATEFAGGTDASNIASATREPFPTTSQAKS
jgi:hypothetical protein